MTTKNYIDEGDRVIIKQVIGVRGSARDKSYIGKTGIVVSNDGLGLCEVKLDDGRTDIFWNSSGLEKISEK